MKVVCIANNMVFDFVSLTINKKYEILSQDECNYYLIDDNDQYGVCYCKSRFITVEKLRHNKLKRIINENF